MMMTILVLGYAYTIWLFTGHNPLPHLNSDLILLALPEAMIEGLFIFGLYTLIKNMRSK